MIYHQSVFKQWPIEDKSVQAIITSPPYWGLRKYDIPDIVIGGNHECQHDWSEHFTPPKGGKSHPDRPSAVGANRAMSEMDIRGVGIKSNFCRCGAWQGQYGLEPDFKDYIAHTVLWVKEAIRVLKDDGVFFLNIGDTYGTVSGNMGGSMTESKITNLNSIDVKQSNIGRHKCKLLIPHRVAIAICDELGLILRNDIVWHKPNAMPESATDRFSKKFESIFMFSKKSKYYFDLEAVREKIVNPGKPRAFAKKGNEDRNDTGRIYDPSLLTGKNPGDMWSVNTQPSPEKHYAMWPQKLVERMVRCSTKPDDIVLDPFCGSGTTLRVAEQLNREGMGIDLGYEEIQERRLSGIQRELI